MKKQECIGMLKHGRCAQSKEILRTFDKRSVSG